LNQRCIVAYGNLVCWCHSTWWHSNGVTPMGAPNTGG